MKSKPNGSVRYLTVAAFTLVLHNSALAAGNNWLRLSGFGTIGGAQSSTSAAAYTTDTNLGSGARQNFEFIDTKVAVQADALVNDKLSFTLQVMSKLDYKNSYDPKVEWAFAKVNFLPNLYSRIGRFYTASFMTTDYAFVGYANTLVRAPVGVYGPRAKPGPGDGADLTWKISTDETVYTLSGGMNTNEQKKNNGDYSKSDNAKWLLASLENGPWLARIGTTWGDAEIYSSGAETLFGAIARLPAANFPSAAGYAQESQIGLRSVPYRFNGVGLQYDDGAILLQTEWTDLRFDSPLLTSANNTASYVTAGYRIRAFTPFVSILKNQKSGSNAPIAPSWMPGALAAGVNAFPAVDQGQRSLALGVRWDFMKNVAAKFQYDHIETENGSSGQFYRDKSDAAKPFDGKVDVISATVDFIF